MTALRLLVFLACVWTAYTTFQRAEMLRKRLDPRPDKSRPTYSGNLPMILCMDLAALAFAGWAIELWLDPSPVSLGAAAVAGCSAVASTVILVSMVGHNWREAKRKALREQDEDDARKVDEATASIPKVVERSLGGVVEEFRKPAPDYDRLHRVEPLPRSSARRSPPEKRP